MLEWSRQRPDDGFMLGVTLRLRGPRPDPQRIAELVTARLPQVPVLAERLEGPLHQERWRADDDFDAARHVHVLAGTTTLRAGAELLADQPLHEGRPRWSLWLLDTDRAHEYLLAYRAHHAVQDGAAMAYTLKRLLDPHTPLAATSTTTMTEQRASTPRHGRRRLLASADVPLPAMRAIVQATGASLNDIYLTALAGALRAWLPRADRDRPVAVRVPFNVRLRQERQDRGNRVGYTRLLLPVDEPKPGHRLARVVEQTGHWPRERTRRLLDRLPHQLIWKHIAASLQPGDALASATLLGTPTPLALDGSPVTGGSVTPPLPAGHLFSTALFLHPAGATLSFTARTEHQHVRDLPRLWENALGDLHTAARA
ncbi:wax ester/triacylglycerol synthase domain-containing protein [Streptomyces sp. NPDC055796]